MPDKNPSRGSGLKIFIQPALKVTVTSQARGSRVTQASRARPILISTVVANPSAITASNWLATPKIGQRLLMPPSGSTTPM